MVQESPLPRVETGRIRLVLIDDHPLVRTGMKSLLGSEPDLEVVAEGEDGLEAIRLASELLPDVLLMDASMPRLGGADATKRIREEHPEVRVLALSMHEDVGFARALLDAGASGYALKRSACDELIHAVRIVASGGTYIDPALARELLQPAPSRRSGAASLGGPAVTLSEREAEVVRLTAQGFTSKEMAQTLGLSPRTLETYKARAMSKLNLRSRSELIRYALRSGWLHDG